MLVASNHTFETDFNLLYGIVKRNRSNLQNPHPDGRYLLQ